MSKGFIKIDRAIYDNPMWLREPFTHGQAWVDLILSAAYKEHFFYVRGTKVQLERGQSGMSQLNMAKRWKWSRGKVKRFLNDLESESMIEQQTGQLTTVISICNYSKYQDSRAAGEQGTGQQTGQQAVQQAGHKQEVKEVKNKTRARFTRPTVDQILEYMTEKNYPSRSEASKFFNFYESKGWCVGKNAMKDWKAATRNWLQDKPPMRPTLEAVAGEQL